MDPGAEERKGRVAHDGRAQQRDLHDILQNLFRAQPRTAPADSKTLAGCVAKALPPEPSRSSPTEDLSSDDGKEHLMLEQQDEGEHGGRDDRLKMLAAPAFVGSTISVHDWLVGPEVSDRGTEIPC
jgi:hypothetical protein